MRFGNVRPVICSVLRVAESTSQKWGGFPWSVRKLSLFLLEGGLSFLLLSAWIFSEQRGKTATYSHWVWVLFIATAARAVSAITLLLLFACRRRLDYSQAAVGFVAYIGLPLAVIQLFTVVLSCAPEPQTEQRSHVTLSCASVSLACYNGYLSTNALCWPERTAVPFETNSTEPIQLVPVEPVRLGQIHPSRLEDQRHLWACKPSTLKLEPDPTADACIICFGSMFGGSDAVVQLVCGHMFHEPCIWRWLIRDGRCPLRCPHATLPLIVSRWPGTSSSSPIDAPQESELQIQVFDYRPPGAALS